MTADCVPALRTLAQHFVVPDHPDNTVAFHAQPAAYYREHLLAAVEEIQRLRSQVAPGGES